MKIKEGLRMAEDAHRKKTEIRKSKAHDYSTEADCLANFKVMAEIQETLERHGAGVPINKPHGVAMWHLIHKVVRILNLWDQGETPENEPIDDSHIDLENYSELARECYAEYARGQEGG